MLMSARAHVRLNAAQSKHRAHRAQHIYVVLRLERRPRRRVVLAQHHGDPRREQQRREHARGDDVEDRHVRRVALFLEF